MTGYTDHPPSDVRDTNDLRGRMGACFASLAGLYHRATTGTSVHNEVAVRDVLLALQGDCVLEESRGSSPHRAGNAVPDHVVSECFISRDGRWVAVSTPRESDASRLAEILDSHGVGTSDDALESRVTQWILRTDAEAAIARLTSGGIPATLSATASDLLADMHLWERGMLRTADHPRLGTLTMVGCPIQLTEHRWRHRPVHPFSANTQSDPDP